MSFGRETAEPCRIGTAGEEVAARDERREEEQGGRVEVVVRRPRRTKD